MNILDWSREYPMGTMALIGETIIYVTSLFTLPTEGWIFGAAFASGIWLICMAGTIAMSEVQ